MEEVIWQVQEKLRNHELTTTIIIVDIWVTGATVIIDGSWLKWRTVNTYCKTLTVRLIQSMYEQDQKVYRCDIWNLEDLWDWLILYSLTSHLNACHMFYSLFKVHLGANLIAYSYLNVILEAKVNIKDCSLLIDFHLNVFNNFTYLIPMSVSWLVGLSVCWLVCLSICWSICLFVYLPVGLVF